MFTPLYGKIGDDASAQKALSAAEIVIRNNQHKMALSVSAFHRKRNDMDDQLSVQRVHPLLRFMSVCLASANKDLIKLAIHIKNSHFNDKDFIKRIFDLEWGTQIGNKPEQNIYRITDAGKKKS